MDVGVGSFVFSLGIVSVRQLATKGQTGQSGPAWLWSCVKALRKSSAVLALGVVRVLMVKGAEYPVCPFPALKLSI
jgi:phosphatidylinositol glycan class W